MSEELEQSGSLDVAAESSPAPEETKSESNAGASESASAKPKEDKEQYVPYTRFKEILDQRNTERNEYNNRFTEGEKIIKELRAELEGLKKPKEADPSLELRDRLKKIDPVFAGEFSKAMDSLKELEALKSWKAQMEHQNYMQSAISAAERLKTELKVDPELHNIYLSLIPRGTPVEKVSELYKAQHDKMSKFLEARERAALSKYTTAKKVDSKVPAQTQGSASKPNPAATKKVALPKDPEQSRAFKVKAIRELLRNQSDT